jgi:3-phenylpropionate/trans-cinnamate dioxygenase ferredoxin reductase component
MTETRHSRNRREIKETYVIVGAGLAGAKAAETLRSEGFEGRIVLVGDEAELPYERPPLSKEYLRGEAEGKPFVHDEGFYSEHEVQLELGRPVTAIDPAASEVVVGGQRLRYDRLLITTGAEPRRLPLPGTELEGVHYLRDLRDSEAIGERIAAGARLVVVGAGWIGAEVAASARQKGCAVTLLEMTAVPLERVLGPEVGAIYRDLHRSHGVEFLPQTSAGRFEGDGSVRRVVTQEGRPIEADLVVVGIGVAPRTSLAEAAGLDVENGIAVGERLETSAPGIFAAGDVANAHHPFYGHRLRVEHWANALNQGPAAARAMLGKPVSYEEIPYFFSDQYESGMEYGGYATEWDEVVFRGDPGGGEFVAFWLRDEHVVAGMNFNVWDVNEQIRELIGSRRPVDRARLADPDAPLDEVEALRPSERARRFVVGGLNYARRVTAARLERGEEASPSDLAPGEGRILNVAGERMAVHRADDGTIHAVSAVCTHLGCLVEFNGAEKTWDCPCHGSRFRPDGSVIRGPARRPLKTKTIPVEAGE